MVRVGIVGLPNVGKTSLFNALTSAGAPAENYPFCTVEPNVGTVEVPDPRLPRIHELAGSREMVPTFIQFVDIAGLVKGASEGEGLGNQFLGQIREVDAIAHVLRCFENPDVTHVSGSVDPVRDLEIVETELILADLDTVERRWEKVVKKARSGEKDAQREIEALEVARVALSGGVPLRRLPREKGGEEALRELAPLTLKPVLYVANIQEESGAAVSNRLLEEVVRAVPDGKASPPVVPVSASFESELALLEAEERLSFLEELGLQEAGLDRVIHASYDLLDLITFFSSNENQTRAWTIRRGTKAPAAAGVIHTDFQKGFIRAEAIGAQEFLALGSMREARDQGVIRSEGKEYVVEDGDILLFRFNV